MDDTSTPGRSSGTGRAGFATAPDVEPGIATGADSSASDDDSGDDPGRDPDVRLDVEFSVATGAEPGAPVAATPVGGLLQIGDVVGGRYEITGDCGRGGSGMTHRGRDQHTGVPVVVKPVRTGAPYAALVARQEREALALAFGHPNLVTVLDRVAADDRPGVAEYIVMEALEGPSLARRLDGLRGSTVPLDEVPDLLACVRRALPAFTRLHDAGFAFCDVKPEHLLARDHAPLAAAHMKWIDVGGVATIGRAGGPWFATDGYRDPQLSAVGPSVATDVYALGRTLLAIVAPRGSLHQGSPLPDPDDAPALAACPALLRLLRRATDPEPAGRFVSVAELGDALDAVIRQMRDPATRRRSFEPTTVGFGTGPVVGRLPLDGTRPVPQEPSAREVADGLPVPVDPAEELDDRRDIAYLPAAVRAALDRGDEVRAAEVLSALGATEPDEWRVSWYRGLLALRADRPGDARRYFDAVADAVPGEPAPELALAVTAELCGDRADAAEVYRTVWRNDQRFVSALFGLARCWWAVGDVEGAVAALGEVPSTSRAYDAARLGAARLLLADAGSTEAFTRADALLGEVSDPRLRVELLLVAWQWTTTVGRASRTFLGVPLTEPALRGALSRALRRLARERDGRAATALIDLSHAVRPMSWW